jgi:hypothetical protein
MRGGRGPIADISPAAGRCFSRCIFEQLLEILFSVLFSSGGKFANAQNGAFATDGAANKTNVNA